MTEGERHRRLQSHPSNTTFVRQQILDINANMYMNFPDFLLLWTLAQRTKSVVTQFTTVAKTTDVGLGDACKYG